MYVPCLFTTLFNPLTTFSCTAIGGQAVTVITSQGGNAITLAASGFGVVTSTFGSVYTVATAAAGNITKTPNAAPAPLASVSMPLCFGLLTVLVSTLMGAFIVI